MSESQTVVDVFKIGKIWGDRVIVRRLHEPDKKRGLYIPQAYAMKKEQKKVWFGVIMGFGADSKAQSEFGLKIGDRVAMEPLGNHYLGFYGTDGFDYVWVPDEHICLADAGSILEYYEDKIDRHGAPKLRIIGNRVLVRPIPEVKGSVIRVSQDGTSAPKWAEVVQVNGDVEVAAGERVLCVPTDAGASAEIPIFEPALIVLRQEDIVLREKAQEMAVA